MKTMVATTIPLDSGVRDRLKRFCGGGMSYSEALTHLMDLVEAERFFTEFEAAVQDPSYGWINGKDMEWD